MKNILACLLFFPVSTNAQQASDTLKYAGGTDSLIKFLVKYFAREDLEVRTSTFYLAEVAFDEKCKISDISLYVSGDTTANSQIRRAIASTEPNWLCSKGRSWRLILPIHVFNTDVYGRRQKAPHLGLGYAIFNARNSTANSIRMPAIEIISYPPRQSTVSQ